MRQLAKQDDCTHQRSISFAGSRLFFPATTFLLLSFQASGLIIATFSSGGELKFKRVRRKLIWTLSILALLWAAGSTALYSAMRRPPEQFGRVMAKIAGPIPFMIFPFETMWLQARAGTLKVGDSAPDFTLTRLDKSDHVQLSSLTAQGRPVVLIFGSYT